MADMGQAKLSVILDLIKNIEQFNEIISDEISNMLTDARELSSCWDDPQYNDFLDYTEQIARQLQNDLFNLESVHDNLKIIAAKF